MIRQLPAVVVALCLGASSAFAQASQITVKAPSADVHKFPSIGSPVIGTAPRGAVLDITRDVGHWVRISWPDGPDGVGYVHITVGTISQAVASQRSTPGANMSVSSLSSASSAGPAQQIEAGQQTGTPGRPTVQPHYVSVPSHMMGVGTGLSTGTSGFGLSGRVWSRRSFGVQFEIARSSFSSATTTEQLRSTQFAPSATFSLPQAVSTYFWLRPYVGGGIGIYRSTLEPSAESVGAPAQNDLGYQAFGGSEVTFAGLPQLAISADVRYRKLPEVFTGFNPDHLTLALSAHWYVK